MRMRGFGLIVARATNDLLLDRPTGKLTPVTAAARARAVPAGRVAALVADASPSSHPPWTRARSS